MYQPHGFYNCPAGDTKIWRYMDLSKLMSLLESASLHFTRSDKFIDPYEFTHPARTIEIWKANIAKRSQEKISALDPSLAPELLQQSMEKIQKEADLTLGHMAWSFRKWGRHYYVNCWHMSPHESDAMWKLYLKSNEGIAVQSTVASLIDAVSENEWTIYVGSVRYIDYEKDVIPWDNVHSFITHKRSSFEHEKELRAVLHYGEILPGDSSTAPMGIGAEVNITKLIQRIYVSPTAPSWFSDLIRAISRRYGIEAEVVTSTLFDPPTEFLSLGTDINA